MCCRVRSCSDRVRWASWRLEWEAVRRCSSSLVSPRIVSPRLLALARGNGLPVLTWELVGGRSRLFCGGLYCGGALAFILLVLALERASPTRVANTMTANPLAAALLATLLVDEPITPNLV